MGVAAAAITGALIIAGSLHYLHRHDFALFAGYRVLVALLIAGVVGAGAHPSLALLQPAYGECASAFARDYDVFAKPNVDV